MGGKDVTRNKTLQHGKKRRERDRKWRRRLREWGSGLLWGAAFCAVYIPANNLAGCTLVGDIPEIAFWAVIAMPAVLLQLRAWFKGNLSWTAFSLYSFIGLLAGCALLYSLITVFLGANYLFPRSEPYRFKAVITSMKQEHHYRQMAHNYIYFIIPDNGVRFSYDSDYKQYDSLRLGDTCTVTFRNGLLGYPVIHNVELTGRKLYPRPSREMLKTLKPPY